MRLPRPARAAVALAAGVVFAPRRAPLVAALREALAREIALGRAALWVAPALALGALAHLALPADPPLVLLAPLVLFALGAALAFRSHAQLAWPTLLLAAAALGMLAVQASVWRASTPRIERAQPSPRVTGHVLRVDPRAERATRVLLAVATVDGLDAAATPGRLMLVGRALDGVRVGAAIAVAARLAPLPQPTHPGAYNPAFAAYFEGIGGYGFVSQAPVAAELPQPTLWQAAAIAVMAWRTALTERIIARLGPEIGPIAAALVTGQRTAITEELNAAFNASGLLHVLSISGLHMALVAGTAFWLIRALLAAVPFLALRLPIKKIAAVLALIVATFYEIASGAEVATTRSYVMIAVMFFAILVDRPAVTMRNLVLAALIIVATMPESVASASFQMSFFATAALIAAAERGMLPRFVRPELPWPMRVTVFIAQLIAATVVVSLVCELSILPIQLYHFNRIVWFGLVGNVLALSVIDVLVMPAAVAVLVLVPLGVGDFMIPALGFGVERMIEIARFVGSFPGAVTPVAGFGLAALALSLAGVTWACLWRTRIALFAIVPYLAGFALWPTQAPPDLRVSPNGDVIAFRGSDGRLALDWTRPNGFLARRWLEADGDGRSPDQARIASRAQCDDAGCTATLRGGIVLALPRRSAALEEDCARADLIVTRARGPPNCARPRLVIDRASIERAHGIVLTLHGETVRVSSLTERCGTRPWCPSPVAPRPRRPFAARARAQ